MANQHDMSYADREAKLDEILGKLDDADVSVDDLADDAKEAVQLIQSMRTTLRGTEQEIVDVLAEIEGRQ